MVSCTSEPYDANDFSGMRHILRVQVFSRQGKPAQALAQRAIAYGVLHKGESNVTVAAHNLVQLLFSGLASHFKEPDGKTWQALMEFEALVV